MMNIKMQNATREKETVRQSHRIRIIFIFFSGEQPWRRGHHHQTHQVHPSPPHHHHPPPSSHHSHLLRLLLPQIFSRRFIRLSPQQNLGNTICLTYILEACLFNYLSILFSPTITPFLLRTVFEPAKQDVPNFLHLLQFSSSFLTQSINLCRSLCQYYHFDTSEHFLLQHLEL